MWDITSSEVLSVSDAVEMGDVWVLLDSRRGSLHFLELNSGRIRSVGRSGPGPGEFRDPVAVAAGDSTIGVLNHRGLFLDEYSLDGGFLRRTRLQGGGCLVGLMKGLSMVAGRDPLLMRICPALVPGPGTAWIERIGPDGNLTPVLSLPLGRAGSGRLHLLRQPAFRAGDHLLFLGTWDAPCISAFSREGEVHRPFCLPDYPRPRTPDAEKSALERRLEKVTALGLLPIRVPDVLPWYDAFFVTSRGIAVRRIRSSEERDIVLLHLEGGASVAQGILPRTTHVGEESILSIEDVLRGSRIRVHANPWR